jgi:NAD(P)-dependent dehydrogenase (short-subunit alcohol dehydrogenase family)
MVNVTDINLAFAERVTQEITDACGTASPIEQDTAQAADSEKVVRHAVGTYGGLHLAVNNAGIGGPQAPAGETDLEAWDKVIGINLNGVLYGIAIRFRRCSPAGQGAAPSSIWRRSMAWSPRWGNGAYTAAKHGAVGITRNAAAVYGPQGLRINCVGPGYIETPLLASLPAEFRAALVQRHPLGRLGKPEEVPATPASSNWLCGRTSLEGGSPRPSEPVAGFWTSRRIARGVPPRSNELVLIDCL